MSARLIYLRLELKRAYKKFPHILAGAIVLLILAAAIALLASKMLYGEKAAERITVGVVLPEGDAVAKKVISMVSSLESVKSICDFEYTDRQECLEKLQSGEFYAVMEVPEGFVQDIMNGGNTPVKVLLPLGPGLESRIFKELADAGARTLGASQAGIYAGNELYRMYGLESSIRLLEEDLNRIYMAYSLPRMDYFKNVKVSATGDVDTIHFYGISTAALFLLLCAIPASSYLSPHRRAMKQKLALMGIGSRTVIGVRVISLGLLLFSMSIIMAALAAAAGWIEFSLLSAVAVLAVCLSASSMIVFLYQAAGTLMGGVMLLFLTVTSMHFLAGGFLPLVFLPSLFRAAAGFMPSAILMEGIKMAVTSAFPLLTFGKLGLMLLIFYFLSIGVEVGRK